MKCNGCERTLNWAGIPTNCPSGCEDCNHVEWMYHRIYGGPWNMFLDIDKRLGKVDAVVAAADKNFLPQPRQLCFNFSGGHE